MAFTFAWVDENDAFVSRNDEDVFAFELSQIEGEFATLQVEIKNPRVGLLKTGRKRWCWFGKDGSPLFKGRLVGIPSNITEEVVQLDFVARPSNFVSRKETAAIPLRAFPYFDPVWIEEERRTDPDAVLEARCSLWHTDRITHAVTASDITSGEDGLIDLETDFFADSLSINYTSAPVKKVKIDATVQWTQRGSGQIDISNNIYRAFKNVNGLSNGKIASLTGIGLLNDWPKANDSIGSGWSFGPTSAKLTDLGYFSAQYIYTTVYNPTENKVYYISWPLYKLTQSTTLKYDAERTRVENLAFELDAQVQEILTEAGDDETILIRITSEDIDQPIDTGGLAPIRDPRRAYYFSTDRGKQSVQFLIALARARVLARARAIEIEIETSLENGLSLNCRKNVRIEDGRLPAGAAIGKVAGYTLYLNGDTGESGTRITLGCMIGKGTSVSPDLGDPVYADNYVALGYQQIEGGTLSFASSDVVYSPPVIASDDYDNVDLFNITASTTIQALAVYNKWTVQQSVVQQSWQSTSDAQAALALVPTYIDLTMKPLRGGPYTANYQMTVQPLAVSKTIDLEAS